MVTANGSKLIGSAQLRRGDVILQHGSMRLQPDAELFKRVFNEDFSHEIIFGEDLKIERIIAVLVDAARDCFGVEFEEKGLSDDEWEEILNNISN
mgnify:CR=1 FL=1